MLYTVEVQLDDGATVIYDLLAASDAHALELAEQEALERYQRPCGGEVIDQTPTPTGMPIIDQAVA